MRKSMKLVDTKVSVAFMIKEERAKRSSFSPKQALKVCLQRLGKRRLKRRFLRRCEEHPNDPVKEALKLLLFTAFRSMNDPLQENELL